MKPQIIIDNQVYQKIMWWVLKSETEVSGLGKVERDQEGHFVVRSAVLLDQENTRSTTDIDPDAVSKAMYELRDEPGHLNFWWHSHGDMGVFWSNQDKETIKEIGDQGWCVATVFNKKREHKTAFYHQAGEFHPPIFIEDCTARIVTYVDGEELKRWDEELKAKCKKKKFTSYSGYGSGYSSGYRSSYWDRKEWNNEKQCWVDKEEESEQTETQQELSSDIMPYSDQQMQFFEIINNLTDQMEDSETLTVLNARKSSIMRTIKKCALIDETDKKFLRDDVINLYNHTKRLFQNEAKKPAPNKTA